MARELAARNEQLGAAHGTIAHLREQLAMAGGRVAAAEGELRGAQRLCGILGSDFREQVVVLEDTEQALKQNVDQNCVLRSQVPFRPWCFSGVLLECQILVHEVTIGQLRGIPHQFAALMC